MTLFKTSTHGTNRRLSAALLSHFEWLVMASRLTNAHEVFQALVNDVLQDFLDRFVCPV